MEDSIKWRKIDIWDRLLGLGMMNTQVKGSV